MTCCSYSVSRTTIFAARTIRFLQEAQRRLSAPKAEKSLCRSPQEVLDTLRARAAAYVERSAMLRDAAARHFSAIPADAVRTFYEAEQQLNELRDLAAKLDTQWKRRRSRRACRAALRAADERLEGWTAAIEEGLAGFEAAIIRCAGNRAALERYSLR